MSVQKLRSNQHLEEVCQSSEWVLVDFWAQWCGPCKMMLPVLEQLATSYQGRLTVAKADVDELQQLAGQYGIRGIPALVLHHRGKPVAQLSGAQPEQAVSRWLDGHFEAASQ